MATAMMAEAVMAEAMMAEAMMAKAMVVNMDHFFGARGPAFRGFESFRDRETATHVADQTLFVKLTKYVTHTD